MLATIALGCPGPIGLIGLVLLAIYALVVIVLPAVLLTLVVAAVVVGLANLTDGAPRLRMVYARGVVELSWGGLWPTRLRADDAGLRVVAPVGKPLVIDADAISSLELQPRGGTRYALMVHTRDGALRACGRDARHEDMQRALEALRRALRLAPDEALPFGPA